MALDLKGATGALNLRGVSFRYGTRGPEVFHDLNLEVPAGGFVSVIGKSGVGKSTILGIVSGMLLPASGEVVVSGEAIRGPRPDRVGFVFQDANLLPWLSALKNVTFPLELQGVGKQVRVERALELLRLVGLEREADHLPKQLSGGMRQRVNIARGLALDPSVLLMDEPFGALDEQTREAMGTELLGIWERTGKTVLFVTHSIAEAIYLSDSVYVMAGADDVRSMTRVEVPLSRPRTPEVIGSMEFGALRNQLREMLMGKRVELDRV